MSKNDSVERLQDKIALLVEARALINSGKDWYICFAIDKAVSNLGNKNRFFVASAQLTNYIEKVLGGCAYFEEWLEIKRKNLKRDIDSVHNYRLQWIDWMISSLEQDLQRKKNK